MSTPCVLLPEDQQLSIDSNIRQAFELRDQANELMDAADNLIHEELGLPRFDESLVPYLHSPVTEEYKGLEIPHPKAFVTHAHDLEERLDASFHVPVVKTVVKLLERGFYPTVQLKNYTKNIYIPPRFKRNYVPEEYGVPFLQGSHIPQAKLRDLKYLSERHTKDLHRWIVEKNWVLVTCSGTIGRIGLVSEVHDQWAASQHILRIIPDYQKGHPGYIHAFLSTPYGQHQLKAKIYGGVVDELTEEDTREIWIPDVPDEIQNRIGDKITMAYALRDDANVLEQRAIEDLEEQIQSQFQDSVK